MNSKRENHQWPEVYFSLIQHDLKEEFENLLSDEDLFSIF